MPAPSPTLDPAAPALRRARGVELLGPLAGSAYEQPPTLVRRVDGQTIQVTPLLSAVLEAIDGERSSLEVAWEVARRTDRVLSADEVAHLVEEKLRPLGLVVGADGEEPQVERSNPLLALRLRFVVSNPRVTNAVTRPFAALFHPFVVVPALLAFVALTAWVLLWEGIGAGLRQAVYEPELLLVVFVLTVASAGFHEFGHAAACRYGGATPGAMGAALYLVWPAFYTDVSDSYRLGRRGRLRVDLGGLYFNTLFALGTFAGWWLTGADALLVLVPIQLFQMVRQLLPLVRFDGYHILADLTGVPDLFARIRPTLSGLLPRNWGRPEHKVLKPWARVVVTAWVLLVLPALALGLALLILGLPRLFATAGDSLRLQYTALGQAFTDGDALRAAVRLVSLVAVALPPLSVVYLLARLARRTAGRIWLTAGRHPYGRPVAAVAFAAAGAFVLVALWPGDQYRPVRPDEQLTVDDGFGLGLSPVVAFGRGETVAGGGASPRRAGEAPDDGPRTLKLVDRPASELADDGGAAPAAGADRGAWPFPFAPPPSPRPQDNFAVAVNTVDGQRVTAMETSMHWLGTARVDHRNRSYALASCVDCTTVATAFQVIVADGTSRTVVPENAAVAVNSDCTTCVTHSIAIQVVVTTRSTPPESVRRQVESRFRAAEALEAGAAQLSGTELRARLHAVEADILGLLAPYTKDAVTDEDTDAGADAAPDDATSTSTTTTSTPSSSTTSTSSPSSTSSTTTSTTIAPSSTTTASPTSTSTSTTTPSTTSTTTPPEATDPTT